MRRGIIGGVLCALVLAACGDAQEQKVVELGTTQQALSDTTGVLGFENVADWTLTQGTKRASSIRSQGAASLALSNFTFTTLASAPLPTLSDLTEQLALDVSLATSPAWGQLQLFINIPSQNVFQALIGTAPLAGTPAGAFQTFTFDVPQNLLGTLQSAYSDLSFRITLNLPYSSDDVLLDHLRFVEEQAEATQLEIQVNEVDDFVYATVDGMRRKAWYIGDPELGQFVDATSWFGASSQELRLFAINTGGPTRWNFNVLADNSPIVNEACPALICNGANQDEGILLERSLQIETNGPTVQSVQVTSSTPGKLYIDDAFTGIMTTGTATPITLSLLPGNYTFGLGVSDDNPPSYSGAYYETEVEVTDAPQSVDVTQGAPLPIGQSTRMIVVPVRQLVVDQFNATSLLDDADLDNFQAQTAATRDQWLEPFSYGLVTWDVDFMDVVEDVPLHAHNYQREPNAQVFLESAGLAHLREQYEIIVLFYNVFDASGQLLNGIVDGERREFNASAWGGGGTVWIHSLWARLWEPTGPNPALLHEVLHNYEGYNQFTLHYYNGVRALHGAHEHGYHNGDNGELDFALWQRHYMRNQVAELTGMRQDTSRPAPSPTADLWVGVFDTMRRGYEPLAHAPTRVARTASGASSASGPSTASGHVVECPPELFGVTIPR